MTHTRKMSQTPALVSIIIPVHNAMPYLQACIASALAQTHKNIEIHAIDDGSTDGGGEELDRLATQEPRLHVTHQPCSGWPGMPRNRGLDAATGDWILFIDADDTIAPKTVENMLNLAETENAEIVIPKTEGKGGRGVQSLFVLHPHGKITLERTLETLTVQKLFSRKLIDREKLRFPEGKIRLEDGIFLTQAAAAAKNIAYWGKNPLYYITKREDGANISTTRINPVDYVASCRKICELLLHAATTGKLDKTAAEHLCAQFFSRKGLRFYTPARWQKISHETRAEWVRLHSLWLEELIPASAETAVTNPADKQKIALLRAGNLADINTLIEAETRLTHTSSLAAVIKRGGSIEIELRLQNCSATTENPQPDTQPGTGPDRITAADDSTANHPDNSSTRKTGSSAPLTQQLKTSLARDLRLLLSPLQNIRPARWLLRKTQIALNNKQPGCLLYLRSRRGGKALTITGAPTENGHYRFFISAKLIKNFHGERVDMWSLLQTPAATGPKSRIKAAGLTPSMQHGTDRRLYSTVQGNLSLKTQ